jgi:hypothetical protein
MIEKSKIAIVTTVVNFELYNKTSTLFPVGIEKYVIDGTDGMYGIHSINFMFNKFKNKNYDWIIMIDEDVFFYDSNLVFELIDYMQNNHFSIAGIRDGGTIKHRLFNPEAINTFFSIVNFAEIKVRFNYKEILSFQKYIPNLYFNNDYSELKFDFNINSLKEPYYCFYFWLHHNDFKFLYLNADSPLENDDIGNTILSPDGKKIAFHSWYARAYNVYEDQTIRINQFLNDFNIQDKDIDLKSYKILKKPFFNFSKKLKNKIKTFFNQ